MTDFLYDSNVNCDTTWKQTGNTFYAMYICVGKIYYASYVCQEWVHFKGLQLPCSWFKKAFVWRISFLLFFFFIFEKLIFQTRENTRQTFVWFGVHRFVMVLEDSPRWLDHTVALWVLRLSCYQDLRLTSDSWLTRGIAVLDLHWIILQWIVSSILVFLLSCCRWKSGYCMWVCGCVLWYTLDSKHRAWKNYMMNFLFLVW